MQETCVTEKNFKNFRYNNAVLMLHKQCICSVRTAFVDYCRNEMSTPAAMAEPMTPEMLDAMQ